ncbi:MAG: hypothetical protein WCQ99_02350 [Pseudomonadota bacterium]
MKYEKEIIDTMLLLPQPHRVRFLCQYAGVSASDVAGKHGCSIVNASLTLRGKMESMPVKETAWALMKEHLGDLCPAFDAVFGSEEVKSCINS